MALNTNKSLLINDCVISLVGARLVSDSDRTYFILIQYYIIFYVENKFSSIGKGCKHRYRLLYKTDTVTCNTHYIKGFLLRVFVFLLNYFFIYI